MPWDIGGKQPLTSVTHPYTGADYYVGSPLQAINLEWYPMNLVLCFKLILGHFLYVLLEKSRQKMLSLMALLDRKRTSDLKLLKEFDYPASTSKLVSDQELLEGFKECGEHDVRLLQEVRIVYPPLYSKFFESNLEENVTRSSGER
ncbi:unnamed protein product [Cylicocyclus nassatus]|uniref:Uncharacterized protein n=1 Tax=Cylicocyclus nassatus TaxID=53992 RepID=A0AA36H556_CYLNA|nr:unnamed protein product [Cylicocyclus nassatus]